MSDLSNFKIPILHQLQGHQVKGKYWFLHWIGKVIYKSGAFFVNLYFINKTTPDNFFKNNLKVKKIIIQVEASLISLLDIGAIFDSNGIYVCKSEDYLTKKGMTKISLEPNDKPINSSVSVGLKKHCSLLSDNDIVGFAYFEKTITKNRNKCTVIIPNYVICKYLYFRNRFITDEILYSTIFNLFDLENFIVHEDRGVKIGTLVYDNKKVLPHEIQSIAQFLFISNNLGYKSINFISSYLQQIYYTSEVKEARGTYIMTDLPFANKIDLELSGQFIYDNSESYFMAYEVKNIYIKEDIFTIDKLILEPMYKNENSNFLLNSKRSYEKLNSNQLLSINQAYNNASIKKMYPLDLGLKTYINVYSNRNKESKLVTFYQKYKTDINFFTNLANDAYSYNFEFIKEMRRDKNYKVEYKNLSNLKLNYGSTQIKLDDNIYKMLVLEIVYAENYFYKIELTNYFTVTLCKEQNQNRINDIDLKIIIEKIINDFSFENGFYRKVTKQDTTNYKKKFNINICEVSTLRRNPTLLKANLKEVLEKTKTIIQDTISKSA